MAVYVPKITRRMLIGAILETNTNEAGTITAAEAAFNVANFSMGSDYPRNKRELMASKGRRRSSAGARPGKCSFDVELVGKGGAGVPLWASTFLPGCDWENTSGTFAAVENSGKTLTFKAFEDGVIKTMTGSRGDFKITGVSGDSAWVHFDFTGCYYELEEDGSLLTPTFPTVLAPVCVGSTVLIAGTLTPILSKFEIAAGNNVVLRESLTHATGYAGAAITFRDPSGSMDPETVSIATRDWRARILASTEEALSIVIGNTANNTMTIAAAAMQPEQKTKGSRNGLDIDNINFGFNGTSPFTIAFA